VFRIPVQAEYQVEEIFHKVRLKWGSDWNEDVLEFIRLWDEQGKANLKELRKWVDRTRYILIAQPRDGETRYEECGRLGDPKALVQRLFKRGKWRQKHSQLWQEDNPAWERKMINPDEQGQKTMQVQAHESIH
jgi:hypothetical protein